MFCLDQPEAFLKVFISKRSQQLSEKEIFQFHGAGRGKLTHCRPSRNFPFLPHLRNNGGLGNTV